MPQPAPRGPPSFADTAAHRCSSSRLSHERSTSADRRLHRVHHEPSPLTPQILAVGTSSNEAGSERPLSWLPMSNTLARQDRQNPDPAARTLQAVAPGPPHRSRQQACRAHCLRSKPHSSSLPADTLSTAPRFPPLGLVRRLPSNLTGSRHAQSRRAGIGQPLTELRKLCRSNWVLRSCRSNRKLTWSDPVNDIAQEQSPPITSCLSPF